MDPITVAESLRQVIDGMDFASAKRLVEVKPEVALAKPDHWPYSIAGNIWHCDYWNRLWLARLLGEKRPAKNIWAEDWHDPTIDEWPGIKKQFLDNLNRARAIALERPFTHAMKFDDAAIKVLNQIAIHTAYHVGQVALLKRLLKQRAD